MACRREPWPHGWNGSPIGGIEQCRYRFQCIGEHCVAKAHNWHEVGTKCLPFVDGEWVQGREKHQRMCVSCLKNSRGTRWEAVISQWSFSPEGRAAVKSVERAVGAGQSLGNFAAPTTSAGDTDACQSGQYSCESLPAASALKLKPTPNGKSMTRVKRSSGKDGVSPAQEPTATAYTPARTKRPLASDDDRSKTETRRSRREPTDPLFLSREQEQKIASDTLWKRFLQPKLPRTTHWGKLNFDNDSPVQSLQALHDANPNLPVMHLQSARAHAESFLLRNKGLSPAEKCAIVRDIFHIEAMHLCAFVCMAEVIFFDSLKKYARYNVLEHNNRTLDTESVKLCCPDCGLNHYVLSASALRLLPSRACRSVHAHRSNNAAHAYMAGRILNPALAAPCMPLGQTMQHLHDGTCIIWQANTTSTRRECLGLHCPSNIPTLSCPRSMFAATRTASASC
jgi:hypothetical protein